MTIGKLATRRRVTVEFSFVEKRHLVNNAKAKMRHFTDRYLLM